MSHFAIREPIPSARTLAAMSSTVTYDSEQLSGSIPSLTLCPSGKDRSTIRCHLFSLPRLGMTPNLLTMSEAVGNCLNGPRTWPRLPSSARYILVDYVWVLQSRAHIAVARHGAAEPREIEANLESFPDTPDNEISKFSIRMGVQHLLPRTPIPRSRDLGEESRVGRRGDGCIAKRLSCPVSGALLRRPNSRSGTPAPARIQRDQKKGKRLRKKKG